MANQAQRVKKKGSLESSWRLSQTVSEERLKRDVIEMRLIACFTTSSSTFWWSGLANGRSFQLGDGSLTQINPDTFEPIVITLVAEQGVARKSTGQRIAGAATGALGGAAGAGICGSICWLVVPIGAVIGGLGGLFG